MPVEQINWRKTVEAILEKSKRQFVPINKSFVQLPKGSEERKSVLSQFVRNGDARGLKSYLLIAASASCADKHGDWCTSLPLQTWARAFGCYQTASSVDTGKTAARRIFSRLRERGLIEEFCSGKNREIKIRLLSQDGSGENYERPRKRFIRLSYDFWRNGYDEKLTLPAVAMLLTVLGEKQPCRLPFEQMPEWYGWSADTAERGLQELEDKGIIRKGKYVRETALSPTGYTRGNEYTVLPPFDRQTLDASRRRRVVEKDQEHE